MVPQFVRSTEGMAYDAVLFDNDGVVTTPTDRAVLERAARDAFAAVGVSEPDPTAIGTLLSPDVPSLRSVARSHDVDPDRLWEARERAAIDAQLEEMRRGRKRPYDDVAAIDRLPVPRGIVSNNQHETIENVLETFDLPPFPVYYGREPSLRGIERKKPTPYYLERAIEDLAVDAPLYVGDSRVDVEAADAIGVDCAFVRRDHRDGYRLPIEPAHEIESLAELEGLVNGG